jgi:hypothetical protein
MSRVGRCSWVLLGVVSFAGVACKEQASTEAVPSAAPAVAASAADAPPAAAPAAPSAAAPSALVGFDPCVVGTWRSKLVKLSADQVTAAGGEGVKMDAEASGATTLYFASMSDIRASGAGVLFDFRYSGKATAKLKTPSIGKFESENADYSALKVTANVKVPGAGFIPMFKDTPVADLVKMADGMAGAVKNLPGAPAAPAPGAPTKGIDAAPVFSSSSYVCRPDSLTLTGPQQTEWTFLRTKT